MPQHIRRIRFRIVCLLTAGSVIFGFSFLSPMQAASPARRNVLFIAIDDLRPELGCYGKSYIKSPHIDRLARQGRVFLRAYCQQAVCGPSRTSLLTGLRPDTTHCWGNATHFRRQVPQAITLPQQFKLHGYHTEGMGKIFHGAFQSAYMGTRMHDPRSWSTKFWMPGPRYYYTARGIATARTVYARTAKKKGVSVDNWVNAFVRGLSTEAPDVADGVLYDGQVADRAIQSLRKLKDRPFFLAVGFIKPHLPFIAPLKYWRMYDADAIHPAANSQAPQGVPAVAMTNWGELRYYSDVPNKGPLSKKLSRRLTHGYRACVSYVDAQVGWVLDELDRLKLRENTIIVLWGDHGWHLGENAIWGKATNFEQAAHAPLIVSVPGMKSAGQPTKALVEFVDIYPSLCELAGLPIPRTLEGTSFVPLLNNPHRAWKLAAFSQFPHRAKGVGRVMGYTMRTSRYRFTEWAKPSRDFHAVELYDHQKDPEENENVAYRPGYAQLVERLTKQLHAGWTAAKPPRN